MNKADIEATGIAHEHEAAHGGGVFTFSERVNTLRNLVVIPWHFQRYSHKCATLTWKVWVTLLTVNNGDRLFV